MIYDMNQEAGHFTYVSECSNGKAQYTTPPLAELLDFYKNANTKIGYLVFEVSTALDKLPVPGAKITISKALGEDFFITKVIVTDIDGKTEPIALPTVSGYFSQAPGIVRPYSTYDASIAVPGYITVNILNIPMFENVTAIQPVSIFPDLGVTPIEDVQQIYDTTTPNWK